jgi:predicted lipid-binding transport protein (Tim44 family)
MKTWLIGALAFALVGASMPDPAEARRFGGGGSMGMQRSMPQRAAPQPAQPQQPVQAPPRQSNPQQQPGQQAGAPAAGAAAAGGAAASRSWLGPIAGLAAGLGLVALLSHLGMGAAFAEFLMLALLLVVGFIAVRFLMARMGGSRPAAAASGGAGAQALHRRESPAAAPAPTAWQPAQPPQPVQLPGSVAAAQPAVAGGTLPPLNPVWRADGSTALAEDEPAEAEAATPRAAVPADFDSEGFARIAKALFVRLQTAHDEGDLDDIRRFTTPEMFAEIRLDLQDRGDVAQRTDVLKVDAEVVDVGEEDGRQIVTVRYRGQVVEDAGGQPTDFDEYWHLVKPLDDSRSWAIAGIEQNH